MHPLKSFDLRKRSRGFQYEVDKGFRGIPWDSPRKSVQPLSYSKGNYITPPSCTVTLSKEQFYVIHYLLTGRPNIAAYIPATALGVPYSTHNSLSSESPPLADNLTGLNESEIASLDSNTARMNQGPTICSTCSQTTQRRYLSSKSQREVTRGAKVLPSYAVGGWAAQELSFFPLLPT